MAFIRKKFIVKPKLQLKYMVLTVIIVVITAFVVHLILNAVLRASSGMSNLTTGEWIALERDLNRSLYLIVGFIAVVMAIESIFFFHRMIGPLFVFERVLQALKDGDLTTKFVLRKGDEFKEVAAHLNQTIERLNEKVKKIKEIETKLIDEASKLPEDKRTIIKNISEIGKELEFFKTQ